MAPETSREFSPWRASSAGLARAIVERRSGEASSKGAKLVPLSLALLLCACTKVNITPLGSTHDGRRQYEVTCNRRATDDGTCNQKTVALCEGSYETQHVGSAAGVGAYNGQTFTTLAERVLLIACNR